MTSVASTTTCVLTVCLEHLLLLVDLLQRAVHLLLDRLLRAVRHGELVDRLPRCLDALDDAVLDVGAHARQTLSQLCKRDKYCLSRTRSDWMMDC